jgi:hypothetical protein
MTTLHGQMDALEIWLYYYIYISYSHVDISPSGNPNKCNLRDGILRASISLSLFKDMNNNGEGIF